MKESEIRIGNIVGYECTAHVVSAIKEGRIESYWLKDTERKELYWDTPSNHEGIPLTEEWLLKAGFKPWQNGETKALHIDAWQHGQTARFDIDFQAGDIYLKSRYDVDNPLAQIMPSIKYLHQLQNLYYALTGTELTFKDL